MTLQKAIISVSPQADAALVAMFQKHALVTVKGGSHETTTFVQGDRTRQILIDQPGIEVAGLMELMDNNPAVCADVVSVPSALATLVLIALGPLAKAGLMLESPAVISNAPGEQETVETFLAREGWDQGITYSHEALDTGTVYALTALVKVATPDDPRIFRELFDECFGRSFFVRNDNSSVWDSGLVAGEPFALYRLTLLQDLPDSLLKVQVIADRDGKCGAAQVVHAFNVICGIEESLPF